MNGSLGYRTEHERISGIPSLADSLALGVRDLLTFVADSLALGVRDLLTFVADSLALGVRGYRGSRHETGMGIGLAPGSASDADFGNGSSFDEGAGRFEGGDLQAGIREAI